VRNKGLIQDLAIILALLILAILFFWPVTIGGKTMLPADNVFVWEPWASYAAQAGVSAPHNDLLSDLYLENYAWKRFIVNSLRDRQLPLWNPYILAGQPFLAAGQHSAMYPLSILFYILPLTAAYGWFAALHLFLAGAFTYILARTLRLSRSGGALAAVTFEFCGFTVTHNVFPMIVAAMVWLPLILAVIERIVNRAEAGDARPLAYMLDLALGAAAFGMVFLAGHPEMYYYAALASAAFTLWRLVGLFRRQRRALPVLAIAGALSAMACLGAGLGAAQSLPLFTLVRNNFREGSASFRDVLGWAYPQRRLISLLIPDFFGNPSHHAYFDLWSWRRTPVTVNALGQPLAAISAIEFSIKNYVEGASYLGVLPSLLAIIGALRWKGRHVGFFVTLAILSILFVFGSPLYWIIYHLPGLNQVHSPFRWILPYSLSMALLAGMGYDALWQRRGVAGHWLRRVARWAERLLSRGALWAGLATLGGLVIALFAKNHLVTIADWMMRRLSGAPQAFADARMFYSYQFRNVLIFGLALAASGLLLWLRPRLRRAWMWCGLAAIAIVGELFTIGKPFFPANDPSLVGYRTPAIDFLTSDPDLFRITTYVGQEANDKPFNANAGMFYDLADIRGYDSIIIRQYAQYMETIQEQGELQYNRIAPIGNWRPEALESPLLDMLNVKYILTTTDHRIEAKGYQLVYDDEVRIYRNDEAMPRAFLVKRGINIPDFDQRREALRSFDPHKLAILEETPPEGLTRETEADPGQVEAIHYTANEVTITVNAASHCFLVLGDTFYDGWLAYIRPADAPDPTQAEQKLHIYRANGNFRAVEVPAGRYVVRFKYSPNEIKFGLYISFLAGVMLALGLGAWTWQRFVPRAQVSGAAQRVTKNTITLIALSLVNKLIDMAFAMLMLRILGPADSGAYYLAVVVISWFDIFTNFGLNTLVTREVAKDRQHVNRYLTNTILLRMGLCGVSAPVLALFFMLRRTTNHPIEPTAVLAIWLFGLGLIPSNISASLSAVFNGYERMETPALVATVTTLLKVTLSTVALVLGKGYVGLAGVSIVVNVITMIILYYLLRRQLDLRPRPEVDWGFQKQILLSSYPLMINHLLATLFFKVAVLLLEWLLKDLRVLGWYNTAYKYIDAIGIIPAYFTMAIFPLMSRFAATDKDALLKAYRLAIKLLLIVAVPGALLGSAFSTVLITILGGSQYLPHAASVLRVMIWYMPFGFINSVTQYVLIALDKQRFLTRAFVIGLAFNVAANLIAISRYGFMAAAYVAVASELALLIPFYVGVRKYLAHIPWIELIGKQVLCGLPLLALWVGWGAEHKALAALIGLVAYGGGLWLWRVFDAEERDILHRVLPLGRIGARFRALLTSLPPKGRITRA